MQIDPVHDLIIRLKAAKAVGQIPATNELIAQVVGCSKSTVARVWNAATHEGKTAVKDAVKLKVTSLYGLGATYNQIKGQTGVSHSRIATIVRESSAEQIAA